ncbi:F-box domain, cyclin-like protein [Artemisia annua]|uniref:F-box domain, cyclin-like protein n=1 Tax=Artemisia annua TaxID=35608 RepID=A0A2U1PJ92_ARTAN|nr:F-box domain, cyclin-like protein [Artemisia annua]
MAQMSNLLPGLLNTIITFLVISSSDLKDWASVIATICYIFIMMFDDTTVFPVTAKMAEMSMLPAELLNHIITFLVTSSDDLRDWASVSATCKGLRNAATEPNILRVVKFQNLMMNRPEQHLHINGLLSRCVRAGNMNAEYMMGKAILYGKAPLWKTMLENDLTARSIKCATTLPFSERCGVAKSLRTNNIADLPYILFSLEDQPHLCEPYRRLHYSRLIRSYVILADCKSPGTFCPLLDFIKFFVGYNKYLESDILLVVDDLNIFGLKKIWIKLHRVIGCLTFANPLEPLEDEILEELTWHKERIILEFDNLFQEETLSF